MTITYPSIQIDLGGGIFASFDGDKIGDATIVEEVNLSGVELPISTLEFTAYDDSGNFSMFDGGIYSRLREKLPIMVYEFIDGQSFLIGRFYLESWKNLTENSMSFTAVDAIGLLEELDFDGVFWYEPVTFTQAASAVLSPLGLSFAVDNTITATVSGWIPPSSCRDALRLICFAAGAVAVTARHNNIQFEPARIPKARRDAVVTIDTANQESIEVLPQIADYEIVAHNYSQSGVEEIIFDEFLQAGKHKIVFSDPYYDISVDGAGFVPRGLGTYDGRYIGTYGGQILQAGGDFTFGSNSVYIDLTEPAQITIRGYKYVDNKRAFRFTEQNVTSGNRKSISITDATLVNSERVQGVLDRLIEYYRLRYFQDVRSEPTMYSVGDLILSKNMNKTKILGAIQRTEVSLTGGFYPRFLMVSRVPPYIPPSDNPVRVPRCGVALCGTGLTRQNEWRQYA